VLTVKAAHFSYSILTSNVESFKQLRNLLFVNSWEYIINTVLGLHSVVDEHYSCLGQVLICGLGYVALVIGDMLPKFRKSLD
jgi:hypothetical protein